MNEQLADRIRPGFCFRASAGAGALNIYEPAEAQILIGTDIRRREGGGVETPQK